MKNRPNFITKYALTVYFLLTFLISWIGIVLIIGFDGFIGKVEVPESQIPLLFIPMCAGPLIAGLLLNYLVEGKKGLKKLGSRLCKWRIGVRWYIMALFSAPLLFVLTFLILSPFSSQFSPVLFSSDDISTLVLGGMLGGIMAGFFEELGWTGFAIPKLRSQFNLLTTGLLIGIIWGIWHLPLFMDKDPEGIVPLTVLLIIKLITFLPAFRILMVWVFDHTKSLLIIILMHMALTMSTMVFQPVATGGIDSITFNLTFTGLIYVLIVVINILTKGEMTKGVAKY